MAISKSLLNVRLLTRKHSSSSAALLRVGLDLKQLGRFVRHTLPLFCSCEESVRAAAAEYAALAARRLRHDNNSSCGNHHHHHHHHSSGSDDGSEQNWEDACRHELSNCVTVLSDFLGSSDSVARLPGPVLFEAHSLLGCLYETLRQSKLASQSFVTALWIAAVAKDDVATEWRAVTLHRLGRAYAALGRYGDAHALVVQALRTYREAGVHHREAAVVAHARDLLPLYEKRAAAAAEQLVAAKAAASSRRTSLSRICEDDEGGGGLLDRRSSL